MVLTICARDVIASCAFGVALLGAAPVPSPTPSAEIGHVVTSDRADEPAAVSARTTYVVTKAEIVRRGYLTVGDAIEDVPGVELVRYGALGAQTSVQIRGASSDQVLVLLDGRPVPGPQLGGVDLSAYSTNGVERVEVVEGPGATLYGSGAVGGVVNIITATGRTPVVTNGSAGAGSNTERDAAVESPYLSLQSLSATNAYGYTLPDGTSGTRTNADVRELFGRATYAGTAGAFSFDLSAGQSDRHLGVPGPLGALTFGERQNDGLADALGTLAYRGAHATTTLELTAARDRINFLDTNPADAMTAGTFDGTSVEARTQVGLRNAVDGGGTRLVYGVDLARESVRNDDGLGDRSQAALAQSALYAQESVPIGDSRVYGGLRAENDGGFGTSLSPSFGAILALTGDVSIRFNGATAFRAPTAAELYYPNFGNPALLPERTTGGDISLVFDRFLGGATVQWFVQNGRDLIAYDAAANTDVNIERASIAGFIGTIATPPLHGVTATLNITDMYRALDLTTVATRLTYHPVIVSNLELAYAPARRGMLDAIGFVAHSEGLRDPSGAAPFTRVDGYVRVRVAPRTVVSVRAFNLGNEQYQAVSGYPAVGRTVTITLATR